MNMGQTMLPPNTTSLMRKSKRNTDSDISNDSINDENSPRADNIDENPTYTRDEIGPSNPSKFNITSKDETTSTKTEIGSTRNH